MLYARFLTDGPEPGPHRGPRCSQAGADRDGLALFPVRDAQPVVDTGHFVAADEEVTPVGWPPVADVYDNSPVGRRRAPLPVRIVTGVDGWNPVSEEDEWACLAVIVGQDHCSGTLVSGEGGDHPFDRGDELGQPTWFAVS